MTAQTQNNMRVTDWNIDWMLQWSNHPRLQIDAVFDREPFTDPKPIYKKQANGLIYYVAFPLVQFYYPGPWSNSPSRHRGFGGREFTFQMEDGSVLESNDVWSSHATCCEVPCAEVVINRVQRYLMLNVFKGLVEGCGAHVITLPADDIYDYPKYVISTHPTKIRKPEKP